LSIAYTFIANIWEECEEGYYYNETSIKYILAKNEFENCKIVNYNEVSCSKCKDDFYLNRTDILCYNNENSEISTNVHMSIKEIIDIQISSKIITMCSNIIYTYLLKNMKL